MHRLKTVAAERIGNELLKTVSAPYAYEALCQDEGRIIRYLVPELDATYGVAQNNRYHNADVFHHTLNALKNVQTCHEFPDEWADKYVCMALLLHDIGKHKSKTTDENGVDHFYGHSQVSAELAKEVLKKFRYSNEFIDAVVQLVAAHDIEFNPTRACVRRRVGRFGVEQLHRLLKIRECDNRAHAQPALVKFDKQAKLFAGILQQVLDEQPVFSRKNLAVNGNDLIAIGYKVGPQIGKTLNELLDEVIAEHIPNDKQILLQQAQRLLSI